MDTTTVKPHSNHKANQTARTRSVCLDVMPLKKKIHGLSICGSLRSPSSNGALLDAYQSVAESAFSLNRLEGIGNLPHFDPNLDEQNIPEEVQDIRNTVCRADLVVFSTPEYIHAMPAVLKNLLEWLVGDPSFYKKPVVILHANEFSRYALESLTEVLATMSAELIVSANIVLPLGSRSVTKDKILENDQWVQVMQGSVSAIREHFEAKHNQ